MSVFVMNNLYLSTAVKVADKMQKEVTLKRNEIDSLKTKMRWYEDKLDSLSRVGHWSQLDVYYQCLNVCKGVKDLIAKIIKFSALNLKVPFSFPI